MEDIFAAADKAVEAKFGDQSGDAAPSGQATSEVKESADQAPGTEESKGSSDSLNQAVLDLSKVDKFILNGKEMTLKQLESERMMQADYQRKTQEIAEVRKYSENFQADFRSVLDNPNLLGEFKKIYPVQYHQAVEHALSRMSRSQEPQQGTTTQDQLVKQLVEDAVGPIRTELDQYKTDAAVKQLDGIFSEMKGKFPQADEEFVLARLQMMKDQDVQINKAKVEEVFKHFHERDQKAKETYHMEQLNKQKQANAKAKDVPSGGGIPGQAPKKFNLSSEGGWSELEGALKKHLSQ